MMTKKLYWTDSSPLDFTAVVKEIKREDDACWLALDQSAFYPEGGGQPCDLGTVNHRSVHAVVIDDGDRIWHRVTSSSEFKPGDLVNGSVDRARRREMTQQHTGQHLLSQAFFQLSGAETRGFRITANGAEIDLALELQADEIPRAIERAEALANEVVFDNRAIRTHLLTPEEAAKLPLRKESFISDCVRVVEVEEFDWSPCGGTHAQRTGEVGLIAVRGFERAKQMTRVHFVCGVRALNDYRVANQTLESAARSFTVGREEVPAAIARLSEENKQLQKRVRELTHLTAATEARELIAAAATEQGIHVVVQNFTDRGLEEIKLLAHRLVESESVIALLAASDKENARLVFARSANLNHDVNVLMKRACEMLNGRGGGKPDFAQGGGSKVSEVETMLMTLRDSVLSKE